MSPIRTPSPQQWAARHAPTHLHHLPVVHGAGPVGGCDAVVVPTSRDPLASPTRGFAHAARLAAVHRAPLLVLVSRAAATLSARTEITRRVAVATASAIAPEVVALADVRPSITFRTDACELPGLASRTLGMTNVPSSDAPAKRNAAIEIAARRGWRNLLFVDDDITAWRARTRPGGGSSTLNVDGLQVAMGALDGGEHRAIGWAAERHADNSVLCRLRRHADLPQGTFIGAGALGIAVDPATPFFPGIYNEDWLFVIGLLRLGRGAVARAGRVYQDRPAGFPTPARAVYEELGDVLGEALMNLALAPGPVFAAASDAEFWRHALARRAEMIERITARLVDHTDAATEVEARWALPVLDRLRELHRTLSASVAHDLCDYVAAWRADLRTWRRHLTGVMDAAASSRRLTTPPPRAAAPPAAGKALPLALLRQPHVRRPEVVDALAVPA